jgi:hypothetical protein
LPGFTIGKFATPCSAVCIHRLHSCFDFLSQIQVPDLINAVKEAGLILATFGPENQAARNVSTQELHGVDAIIDNKIYRVVSRAGI